MSQEKPGAGRSPLLQHPFAKMDEGHRKKITRKIVYEKIQRFRRTDFCTMTNEYPVHKDSQPPGHSGIRVVWLWMAMTLEVVSHTEHLNRTCIQTPILLLSQVMVNSKKTFSVHENYTQ